MAGRYILYKPHFPPCHWLGRLRLVATVKLIYMMSKYFHLFRGFQWWRKKETILHWGFMAQFYQPLWYTVCFSKWQLQTFFSEMCTWSSGFWYTHIYFLNKQTLGVAFWSMQVQVICRKGKEHLAGECPPGMPPLLCLLCAIAHLKWDLGSEAISLQVCRKVPGHAASLHPSSSV